MVFFADQWCPIWIPLAYNQNISSHWVWVPITVYEEKKEREKTPELPHGDCWGRCACNAFPIAKLLKAAQGKKEREDERETLLILGSIRAEEREREHARVGEATTNKSKRFLQSISSISLFRLWFVMVDGAKLIWCSKGRGLQTGKYRKSPALKEKCDLNHGADILFPTVDAVSVIKSSPLLIGCFQPR